MTQFDLELKVTVFGSILTWKVYLQDSTNENRLVKDWEQGSGFRQKKLPQYMVPNNTLKVFASCQGIIGGYIEVEVIINGQSQTNKVKANVTDDENAKQTYTIQS